MAYGAIKAEIQRPGLAAGLFSLYFYCSGLGEILGQNYLADENPNIHTFGLPQAYSGHPFGPPAFVVSHPTQKKARRMGHPCVWLEKSLVEKVDRIGRNQIYFFRFTWKSVRTCPQNAAIVEHVTEVKS